LHCTREVREATLAAVDRVSDSDLDKPNSDATASIAPTLGVLSC
jgi:hypothetical protein